MMFTFIDLFAGAGGFHIAAERNGGVCLYASELCPKIRNMYSVNFPETPLYGDITLPENQDAIPSDFDLLCGGFPCQPFSIAGKRQGFDDPRGTLFFEIWEILRKHQPKMFVLENVPHLKRHDDGRTLQTIRQYLTGAYNDDVAYHVTIVTLNAKDYGLPQSRERIFIIGWRKADFEIKPSWYTPLPTYVKTRVGDILEPDEITVQYTLTDKFLAGIERRAARKIAKGGKARHKILNASTPYAPTLTTRYGCGGFEALIDQSHLGLEKPRHFSPRECFRLQGFPDTYIIAPQKYLAYKMAGNAIAVNVVEALIKSLVKYLN